MLKVIVIGAGNPRQSLHSRTASLNGSPTGSTGLLVAQGLKTVATNPLGSVAIYKRDTEDRFISAQREWGMHWGGEFLSKALPENLRSKLDEIDYDPFHKQFQRNWICTVKWKDWRRHPGHAGHDAEEGLEKEIEDFIGKGKGLLIVPCLPRYVADSSSSAKSSLTLSLRQRARRRRLGTVPVLASSLAVMDRSHEFENSWLAGKRLNCQVQILRL